MKLVKGRTLAALLEAAARPGRRPAPVPGVFEQVCQTMAYAHARGVIHRDLKPSNVMVGAFGEVQVMDWGLAKVLAAGGAADDERAERRRPTESVIRTVRSGSAADASLAGSVLGTPAYMAPEQAGGEIDALDERADVFGLGAILCEILTGRRRTPAGDAGEVLREGRAGRPGRRPGPARRLRGRRRADRPGQRLPGRRAEDRPRDAGEVAADVRPTSPGCRSGSAGRTGAGRGPGAGRGGGEAAEADPRPGRLGPVPGGPGRRRLGLGHARGRDPEAVTAREVNRALGRRSLSLGEARSARPTRRSGGSKRWRARRRPGGCWPATRGARP